MLQRKLLAMFNKNPKNVHSFDYRHHSRISHPFFQNFYDIYM